MRHYHTYAALTQRQRPRIQQWHAVGMSQAERARRF
ncbi:MAG: hypothetical protein GFH27_549311n1, partial [Chloroflexi bacterium AL-W]|nr:hypothetical protein [Chloroflexi bacterium AL-N1]NOK68821.1 hypothetical protein [Chloroflexi bacterium AL-N10]NOK76307.1 hypothetical protein [Chloroflexi bacterium AL-N5]NOK84056.1 hypothetical protein [Chloroflexi bacterium AL-W]